MDITRTTQIEDLPAWLTVREVLACVPIPRTSLYGLLKKGTLPASRVGRRLYIKREAVAALFTEKGA